MRHKLLTIFIAMLVIASGAQYSSSEATQYGSRLCSNNIAAPIFFERGRRPSREAGIWQRICDFFVTPLYAANKGAAPVAYWRFDEGGGATAYDDSTNNNDGTMTPSTGGTNTAAGQMWTRQGKISGAAEFDGTDDRTTLGDVDLNNGGNTVGFWVKASAIGANKDLFSKYTSGSNNGEWNFRLRSDNKIHFWYYASGNHTFLSSSTFSQDQWYYVTFVYTWGTGSSAKWYINGQEDTGASWTDGTGNGAFTDVATAAMLGAGNSGSPLNFFNGYIDDVRIYNYARTAAQVMTDYNAGSAAHLGAGTDPNEGNPPVGYWTMNEGSGSTVYDRSGNNNNGTITNATFAAGKHGSTLSFDGDGDYVDISASSTLGLTSALTFEAWIKPSAYGTWDRILESNVGCCTVLGLSENKGVYFGLTKGGSQYYINGTSPVSLGTWQHVVGTWDGTTMKTYVNGIQKDTMSLAGPIDDKSSAAWKIGRYVGGTGYDFSGLIDEVKIYDYARTQAQIAYDYNKGKPIAHYRFDEGTGPITRNDSSSAHEGAAPFAWYRMDEATSGSANGTDNILDETGNASHGSGNYGANTTGMSWTAGKIGPGALDFDGTDDWVDIPDYTPNNDSFTISAWFNLNSARSASSDPQPIFGNDQNNPFLGYQPSTKQFKQLRQYSGGSQSLAWTTTANLADDSWHHVAVSVDQTNYTAEVFLDGASLGSNAIGTEGYTHSNGRLLGLGKDYASFFMGKIDDVRLYDYARTAEQIYNDYKNTHGTLVADTKFVDGKIGKALEFDGTGDYVECGADSNLDITNNITIEAWIYHDGGASDQYIITKGDGGTDGQYQIFWRQSDDKLNFESKIGGGWKSTMPNVTLEQSQWVHYAVTYDGANITHYVDGVEYTGTSASGSMYSASGGLKIGRYASAGQYFDGKIDDVRIYNYARTAAQVMQDYSAGSASRLGAQGSGLKDPWGGNLPVAHWKLDENTGVLARDASENGNDGTLGGDGAGTDVPTWTQGKHGPGLSFDGGDYVSYGTPSSLNLGQGTPFSPFTMQAWIKTTQNTPGAILSWGETVAGKRRSLFTWNGGSGNNKFYFSGAYAAANLDSGVVIDDDVWHHVAVTCNASEYVEVFVDGQYKNGATLTLNDFTYSGAYETRIGNNDYGEYFNGLIDDVRIYDYVRTHAQIAWDYNRGKPVAHYRMDEATSGAANSQTIYDDSDNDNDGTANYGANATGMTWTSGKFGGALDFDGVDDYVSIPAINIGTGPVTFSAWVKGGSRSANQEIGIITVYESGKPWFFTLERSSWGGGSLLMYAGYPDQTPNYISGGTWALSDTNWHHVAMTRDSTSMKLYFDGAEVNSTTNTNFTNFDAGNRPIRIGYPSQYYWDDKIDDVRIYNYTRTAAQIMEDFNAGAAARLGD